MTEILKYVGLFAGLFVLMVGIIIGALYFLSPVLQGRIETPAPPPVFEAEPQVLEESQSGVSGWDDAESAVVSERDALQTVYEERADSLDPELRAPVEENLGIIEGAVAELTVALGKNPDDPTLKRMIVETYRNEIRLLKRALHLGGESAAATDDAP